MPDWKKIDSYYWEHPSGYRICESGPDTGKVYLTWAPREHPYSAPQMVGVSRRLADAKRRAEEHAKAP